ncbi:hypothetical protein SAMN02745831_04557 [Streptomyces sp. PgraA7]|nr:hypothetical protein SAMN02745831_04557 [Streptomyces sp. PgraA7]
MTSPAPRWRAIRAAMAPIGPRPSTVTLPPGGMSAYLHAMERNTGATVLDTDGVSL